MPTFEALELHQPSPLTLPQKELVVALATTPIRARIKEKYEISPGNLAIRETLIDTNPLAYVDDATRGSRFCGVEHETIDINRPTFPLYVNLRNLPEVLEMMIAKEMSRSPLEDYVELCDGIPKTGKRLMELYSQIMGIQLIHLLDKIKVDDKEQIVKAEDAPEGEGQPILFGDDVISTGASKEAPLNIAREEGYKPIGVVILADRRKINAPDPDYKLYSRFHVVTATHFLASERVEIDGRLIVNPQTYQETINYFSN